MPSVVDRQITFGSYDINTNGAVVTKVPDISNLPDKVIEAYELAREDGSKIVDVRYSKRKITIDGYISGADRDELEDNKDLFLQGIAGTNGNLDISYGGSTRRFIATLENVIFDDNGAMTTFSAEFLCTEPFGEDTATTEALNAPAETTTPNTLALSPIGGTYKTFPTITIEINSLTSGAGSKAITITNPATGQAIEVSREWSAGEVLTINCKDKSVDVDGTAVDYDGVFPYWDTGAGSMKYEDEFTARNVDIVFAYTKRYI